MNRLSTLYYFVLLMTVVSWSTSCFPEDYDRCGEGYEFKRNDCYKIESDPSFGGKPNDAGADGDSIELDEWIGSPCSCEGEHCTIAGAPTFYLGTIVGCDNVPKEWPGAALGCMQTYVGDLNVPNYYAQGFCTLMAGACEGDDIICNIAVMGEYQKMTRCPEDTVMVITDYSLSVSGLHASLSQKICSPACDGDEDCRTDDYDETIDSPGQYECIDKDGVSFCHDARNLPDEYTVEAF